jgi:DNA polymerase I
VVQGSCAEVVKLAMLDLDKQLSGKAQIVNTVHDELVFECNEADAENVKVEMKRVMQKRFADVFEGTLIEVDVDIVDDWSQKGAKPAVTLALAA